ncbi:MAG: cation transporter [Candidatus Nanopelagicales bacterium]|nr:cation transporter [Candidatus Nanopelagicales bacterium]
MSTGSRSTLHVPGMDCSAEESLVRAALAPVPGISEVAVDLRSRRVAVRHQGGADPLVAALAPLGLGARLESSEPAPTQGDAAAPEGGAAPPGPAAERRVLAMVLAINAVMFVVELVAGLWAGSTGLLADSLDMLADATVYAIALAAVGGALVDQRRSARASGWLQLALAGLVLVDVVRRALGGGEPRAGWMIAVGILALLANLTCVALLAAHRHGGVHLRASWIFTTNDALANLGVIVAGQLVALTGSAWPDLVVGTVIAALVASGAWRILRMLR